MTSGSFLFLGSGGSMGIPVIGCRCDVCRSPSPHNKRLRPSALITINDKKILIDCGPDFRYQSLRINLRELDGVILTHAHHDHTAGIDDLRVLYLWKQHPLPCLLSRATVDDLRIRYHYIFTDPGEYAKLVPKFSLTVLNDERGIVPFLGSTIGYMTYEQGGMLINGFRFGKMAYISDISHFPETIYEDLEGVETLVLSALRFEPSPMHFHIDKAVEFAKRVGARQTWFTHIAHELDHEKGNSYLPSNIRLAYDGLSFDF